MRNDLPPATIEWVFPPNKAYDYFQASDHAFIADATEFQLANAWWLAEASLLAYADPDFAIPIFNRVGLRVDDESFFSGPSTQCYVAYTDDFVIVAFRGTQVYKPGSGQKLQAVIHDILADCTQDGRFGLVPSASGGFVHRGFLAALDEIWEAHLLPYLTRLQAAKPERKFWFTGHSLGAALATLAVVRYPKAFGLYTYGSPFVGDEAFAKTIPVQSYRFVNNNDIVPTVPPVGPYLVDQEGVGDYRHVGHLKYIHSDGSITDDPGAFKRFVDGIQGNLQHFFNSIENFKNDWIFELPDDRLNDHGPVYYSLSLRQKL